MKMYSRHIARVAPTWHRWLAIYVIALLALADRDAMAGDSDAGRQLFTTQCGICHTVQPGRNALGPSLFGVVGRPSATVPGFAYSAAFKKVGVTWDAATLDKYLVNPSAMVPGTKMTFAGLKDDAKRADVIAYLSALK